MLAGFKHEKDQKEESSHGQMEVFEHDQEKDITIKQHLQIEKEDKVDVQDEVKFEDLNKNCEETGGNILHHFCSEMQDNDIQGEEDNTEINNHKKDEIDSEVEMILADKVTFFLWNLKKDVFYNYYSLKICYLGCFVVKYCTYIMVSQ